MSNWKADYVEANGIRIHYHRTGGAKPALVLCHGATDNGLCWTPLAQALEADYDLIMPDARGHGLSDAPETGYDARTLADDLAAFIMELGLSQPAVMGHSMGGATAAALAAWHPAFPGAIILEDPVIFGPPPVYATETEKAAALAERRAEFEKRQAQSHEALMAVCAEWFPKISQEACEHWAESKHQVRPQMTQVYVSMPNLADLFPLIPCPTLILKADADEAERKQQQAIADLLQDGNLVHVAGAGHNVRRDQFDITLGLIRDFLATLQT
ncbi:MAG: alpha/beta hydrolase [Anaerolineae bacterium]|nr:alpha/beta hydrolase [Anaerolineae bacterium]